MERNRRSSRIGLLFALCMASGAALAAATAPPADSGVTIPIDFSRPMTVKVSITFADARGNLEPIARILADAGFEYELHVSEGPDPTGVAVSSRMLATRTGMFSSAEFNAFSTRLGPAAARADGKLEWTFVQPAPGPAPAAGGD